MNEAIVNEEKAALALTLQKIKVENVQAQKDNADAHRELMDARRRDPDMVPYREMAYAQSKQRISHLASAALKPYFTRVDFSETPGKTNIYYLGKYGVTDSRTLEPFVYDWRAPIGNLYYCGQLGHVSYEAPDGTIEGELSLKRQIEIENGELLSVFDTDIVSQDKHLQNALSAMTSDKLKDIVSTIQSEQNLVIRHPLTRSLVVQGVAGSGKTTIALHRVAYLLYAYANRLRAERMLILAPSPLFLNYISGVLPDLGVENIPQTTYNLFVTDFLALRGGALKQRGKITEEISRAKGSMDFCRALRAYLDHFEKSIIPEEGFTFGPLPVFTKAEADKFLLVDEAPFPMKRRIDEFKKQLTRRVSNASSKICAWFKDETARREEVLWKKYSDSPELTQKTHALYASLSKRIEETKAQCAPFVNECMKRMPSLDLFDLYRDFLNGLTGPLKEAAAYTLSYIKPGCVETEDLAPLAFIALRVRETLSMPVRHVVIDECQDLSPIQIAFLKQYLPDATFTLVGDLMQGITESRGVSSWEEITQDVLGEKCDYTALNTSYRSTKEIMDAAFRVSSRFRETKDLKVVRGGSPVVYKRFADKKEQDALIRAEIGRMKELGCTSVGILAGDEKEAAALKKNLEDIEGLRLLTHEDTEFGSGLYVTDARCAKGLEFDAVIVADASEKRFGETLSDAQLLYVCLTRPLHHLTVLYEKTLTPLLREN